MEPDIEAHVTEYPEYGIYAEILHDNKTLYLTIDATHLPSHNMHIKVNPTNCTIYLFGEPLYINYPDNIHIDPSTAKITKNNGIIDITAKIIRRNGLI